MMEDKLIDSSRLELKERYIMIIIDILIVALTFILTLLMLLLFVPFCYGIKLSNDEKGFFYRIRIYWMFGLFQLIYNRGNLLYIRIFGILMKIKNEKDKKAKIKNKNEEHENVRKKHKGRKVTKKGVKYFIECFTKLVKKYKPKKLVLSGELGFEDPSITGFIQGLANVFEFPVDTEDLKFIYNKDIYNWKLHTSGKITGYYLFFIFLKLILYKPTRNLLR